MAAEPMAVTCIACGCNRPEGNAAHAVRAVLIEDDLDRALALGLLDVVPCENCEPPCTRTLLAARDTRIRALAARERFRARQLRLARRKQEHSTRRSAPGNGDAASTSPPLPASAAAALARAKAKAASRR